MHERMYAGKRLYTHTYINTYIRIDVHTYVQT